MSAAAALQATAEEDFAAQEFFYKLPGRFGGHRPGAHGGHALGSGQRAVALRRLLDQPDPRRIDLRASLRSRLQGGDDWLVRVARQHVALPLIALVDVSASMRFGAWRRKLDVAADLAAAIGLSAFRHGDAAGLWAFDGAARDDLRQPPRHGRGVGAAMAGALRGARHAVKPAGAAGLLACAEQLAGRQALLFLVSDFHGIDDDALRAALRLLSAASIVPVIAWDAAETEPPTRDGLLLLDDAETPARRALWVGAAQRRQWREAVAARHGALDALFDAAGCAEPFLLVGAHGGFDAEALTRYFIEGAA